MVGQIEDIRGEAEADAFAQRDFAAEAQVEITLLW